jgi:hypothetical protein
VTLLQWLDTLSDEERYRFLRTYDSIGGPRRRVEVVSTGIDESLQHIGSSGNGGISWEGLRVPFAPFGPPLEDSLGIGVYLFCAFYFEVAAGERKRIRGLRCLHKIGLDTNAVVGAAQIPEELYVRTPTWRFRDGFVTYHLRELGPTILNRLRLQAGAFDTNNLSFRMAKGPALLYENIHFPAAHLGIDGKPDYYVFLDGYVPPNGGVPYGTDLGGLGTIYDPSRYPYNNGHAWEDLDVVIEGGENTAVAGFICVRQTNPGTRPRLAAAPTITSGISQEEQFILDYPEAIDWRVGMAAVVEDV